MTYRWLLLLSLFCKWDKGQLCAFYAIKVDYGSKDGLESGVSQDPMIKLRERVGEHKREY